MPSQSLAQFIDVPALLVQARYRGKPLASRLLSAGERRGFAVGAASGADAPVDAAFVEATPGNDNHVLVQPSGAGFLINLSPAMRSLSDGTELRIACGEVVFELNPAAHTPAVPRPWLSARAKDLAPYLAGVGLALGFLLAMLHMVPSDARALSLDDLGRNVRLDAYRIAPSVAPPPPPVPARGAASGGATMPASGATGAAGDRHARSSDTRRASKGPAERQDARAVEKYLRENTMLAVLDGPRGQAFAQVLSTMPALGDRAETVLAHLEGPSFAEAYGTGLGPRGTGTGGADTGKPMIGGEPGLGTIGKGGGKNGVGPRYGAHEGRLARREPHVLPIVVPSSATVRGALDKEIVRRVVRRHLNEVRYCYESSLARRPSLAGRVVTSFTIAPTGRVLSSLLQSSTLADAAVEACIVGAVRRWEFPAPDGGGVVIVSYPFQLAPAGA